MQHIPTTVEEQLFFKAVKEECPWENLPKRLQAIFNSKEEWHRRENIKRNHTVHEELLSALSSTDAEVGARTGDITAAINDSLLRDRECKKEIDSLTNCCLDQLKTV
ncbi:hypothetical protein J1N35_005431 [Gossypium stocksii]|uniref:Uncharacterized protein n=1 Tax=Gossypium stocksii TaxID=47602 RepID=A0A9D4AJ93_9ROSI|nr:hypothetical protein J1N35_005431 [Gossypium stocksii]